MKTSVLMLLSGLLVLGCNGSSSKKTTTLNESTSEATSPTPTEEESETRTEVNRDLINQTTSKVTFDKEQNIYLVSVPPIEKIIIKNPALITAHIGFCSQMKMIKSDSNSISRYKDEIAKVEISLIEKNKRKSTLENELNSRRDTLSPQQIRTIDQEIILVSYEIQDLKRKQERLNQTIESYKSDITRSQEIMLFEGSHAQVTFESDLKKNIDQLQYDNPDLTFQEALVVSKIPITLKAVGLESYPAEEMILGLKQYMGIFEEDGQMFISEYMRNLGGTVRLSLYGACPLVSAKKFGLEENMKEIVIEIAYGE